MINRYLSSPSNRLGSAIVSLVSYLNKPRLYSSGTTSFLTCAILDSAILIGLIQLGHFIFVWVTPGFTSSTQLHLCMQNLLFFSTMSPWPHVSFMWAYFLFCEGFVKIFWKIQEQNFRNMYPGWLRHLGKS